LRRRLDGVAGKQRKRVLVTGGAGFISSNFICHLLEETDHDVVTLDALTYAGNLENLADVMSHPRLSFVHGGTVTIDSVPGQGTTVTCVFPVEHAEKQSAA
jgi:dTDP-D-glucose 4,6-dehydratase